MTTIKCVTGSESFRNGSSAMIVSCMGTRDFDFTGATGFTAPRGLFISEATKQGRYVTSPRRATYLPAANNGIRDHGNWWSGDYEVPEGMVLRVYARRRTTGSRRNEEGIVFIQAREAAPLNRLRLNTFDNEHSASIPVIVEGRFDILTLREAGVLGVHLDQEALLLSKADRVLEVMSRQIVAREREARAKIRSERVTDHTGEQRVVTTSRKKRATRL